MATKPVQVSLDTELLNSIDRDAETRRRGRSAFIRAAVRHYLAAKRRGEIDASIQKAYAGVAHEEFEEITDFIRVQSWPPK